MTFYAQTAENGIVMGLLNVVLHIESKEEKEHGGRIGHFEYDSY